MSEIVKVLYVEDNSFDQLAFNRLVRQEELPYDVNIAGSLTEAKKLLGEDFFDIVLIDYRLGADTAFDLLNELDDTPSIIITGMGDEEVAVQAMKLGVSDYLVKDMEGRYLKTLPMTVEKAIQRKRAEDELEQYRRNLEALVQERTIELTLANEQLMAEISEREQAEERIRLLASALESAANSVTITDASGVVLWVNPAFTALSGYTSDEVVGKTLSLLESSSQDNDVFEDLWETIESGRSWHGELEDRRKDDSLYHVEMIITPVLDQEEKITNFITIKQDVTERVEIERKLEHLATHDRVTGLPNRLLFNDRLSHALTIAKRNNQRGALLFIDLDDFKTVNDAYSHEDGDRLLRVVARRLRGCLRESDTVARIGGDEFSILIEDLSQPEDVAFIAQKITQAVSTPANIRGSDIFITASIGVCIFPDDGETIPTLLQNADAAMYRAKAQGKNTYQYYTSEMTDKIIEQLGLTTHLRHAIEREDLLLYYQPQVDARTEGIVAMEALLRLKHPEKGLIQPKQFVPLAEKTGLIVPIGEWVLRSVCNLNRTWQDAGLPPIRSAINISGRQLTQPNLVRIVQQALDESNLDPGLLELEIIENIAFREADRTIGVLQDLKALGVKLAIDDFGTGYSSLGHLARFPLDTLKIDLSFTQKITADPNAIAIVTGMIAIANSLGMSVVVEGVETKPQLDFFQSHGCNLIQGWYFCKPVSEDEMLRLLLEGIETA